jgi:hypothetical protein
MKRMRYLAGAAGLMPAAVGMAMMPAEAQGATTHVPTGSAKTVSLRQILGTGMTARTAHLSATTAPPAAAPQAQAAADCTGNVYFTFPTVAHVRGHGWYKYTDNYKKFCIGTVVVSAEFTQTSCHNIWAGTDGYYAGSGSIKIHDVCGHRTASDKPEWFPSTFVFRKSWVEPGTAWALNTKSSRSTYKGF